MNSSAWFIREIVFPQDYPQVAELWQSVGGGVRFGKSDTKAEIQKKLLRDPDLFLVVELDGRIIGTVLGGFDGRRGMIYHLAVAENYRKQGIAHALMNEIENRITAKGALKIYLMMDNKFPDLVKFYTKLGWSMMDVVTAGKEFYPK